MFESLLILTTGVVIAGMWYAYHATRDPLHPLMYLGPMILYAFVVKPWLLIGSGWIDDYFQPADVVFVQVINLLGTSAFVAGCLFNRISASQRPLTPPAQQQMSPPARRRVQTIACVLGFIAVLAFVYITMNVGGLAAAYGRAKGGGHADSGYISEAQLLAFPAIILLFLAWRGQPFTPGRIALLLTFASPHLLHGILGARRGPTFLILAALLLSAYVTSGKRPKLRTVAIGTSCLGILMLFLVANRSNIYLGSQWEDPAVSVEQITESQVTHGEDWSFAAGMILTSNFHDTHFWGRRLFTVVFIRPIPKQIWPTKYHDVGMGWMLDQSDMGGLSDAQWMTAVGWIPQRGSAAGFVADLFLEFSYLGIAGCFLFGYVYSFLWRRATAERGIWTMLYLFAAILSVYVPTQSVSAWLHRFLLMSVPAVICWRYFILPVMSVDGKGPMVRGTAMGQAHAVTAFAAAARTQSGAVPAGRRGIRPKLKAEHGVS